MGNLQAFSSSKRRPLHEFLPLPQPLVLNITVSSLCNFMCKFCFRSATGGSRSEGNMSVDLFKKLITGLSGFEGIIDTLSLAGDGEPLLHPQLIEIIKIAKGSNKVKNVKITTNASMLTQELSRSIISAGTDIIIISINGISDEHYKSITNRDVDFNGIRDNIAYLYSIKGNTHIHIKCIGDYFSAEQKEEFVKVFSPLSDTFHIDNVANQWLELKLDTKSDNRFGLQTKSSSFCNRPFYQVSIRSDGKVTACVADRKEPLFLGDTKETSLKDIWNGKTLYDLRMAHLSGNFRSKEKYINCAMCSFTAWQTSEGLTPYREDLIKKYERKQYEC